MDTKSKVLIAVFFAIVVAATVWKYDAFVTRQNFLVYDQVPCDPVLESCFAYECEEGDEECDDAPFKKVEKSARNITLCPNYVEGECAPLSCAPGEEDCNEILCAEETLEEGEICVTPEDETLEPESSESEEGEADSHQATDELGGEEEE